MDEKKMPHLCVFALTKIKPIIPKKKSYQSLWTSMQEWSSSQISFGRWINVLRGWTTWGWV